MPLADNGFALFAGKTCSPASTPLHVSRIVGVLAGSISLRCLGGEQQGPPLRNPSQRKKSLSSAARRVSPRDSFACQWLFLPRDPLRVCNEGESAFYTRREACFSWPRFPQVCQEPAQADSEPVAGQGAAPVLAEQSWEAVLCIQLVLRSLLALELPGQAVTLCERPCR